MNPSAFLRASLPVLAIALATLTSGCSHDAPISSGRSAPAAAPVYPGARAAPSGSTYSTTDSFKTVYTFYQQNLPPGSERTHAAAPGENAIFLSGSGIDRLKVTVTPSPVCCRTLIVIARAKG